MKIGTIQLHLKARSHARLNHVSAFLPLAISLTPNRALADCGHVRQGIMVDAYNQLGGANGPLGCQTEDQRSHPNGNGFLAQCQNGQLVISSAVWPNSRVLNGRHQIGGIACCA
jgi:hypothetical protein